MAAWATETPGKPTETAIAGFGSGKHVSDAELAAPDEHRDVVGRRLVPLPNAAREYLRAIAARAPVPKPCVTPRSLELPILCGHRRLVTCGIKQAPGAFKLLVGSTQRPRGQVEASPEVWCSLFPSTRTENKYAGSMPKGLAFEHDARDALVAALASLGVESEPVEVGEGEAVDSSCGSESR